MSSDSKNWWPLLQSKLRQGRRMFDKRLLNERRLIIVAVLALIWMVFDAVWLTPGFKQLQDGRKRAQAELAAVESLQTEVQRLTLDHISQQRQAELEIRQIQTRLAQGGAELARQQALLVPASQMADLLRGLLEQNGQLRLIAMRTMPPQEVMLSQSDMSHSMGLPSRLYRHRIEMTVSGSYLSLVRWLQDIENMPRKLMWDQINLQVVAPSPPQLTFSVHTYSPDRDALEIAP